MQFGFSLPESPFKSCLGDVSPACSRSVRTPGHLKSLHEVYSDIDSKLDGRLIGLNKCKGFGREDDLNSYSILQAVPLERKLIVVEEAANDNFLNRVMGCMQGMAVGDSLGHHFEFMPAQDYPPTGPHFDLAEMKFIDSSNAFRLEYGQWTDDAAMGLCTADSLIIRKRFDGSDMRIRFWCWWNRGYNNAFRKDPRRTSSVGLGGNIAKSLFAMSNLLPGQEVPPLYEADGEDAGNGSLMRFAPVAIFHHAASIPEVLEVSRLSSYTTHPGIIAAEACAFLSYLLVRAFKLGPGEPESIKTFLDQATSEYLDVSGLGLKSGWGYDQMKWLVTSTPVNDTELCWNWKDQNLCVTKTISARGRLYNGYPVSRGYFGSYSLDGLALALWSVYHSKNFDDAVVKSVNLLGDADSHGSITGQLAGALYGYKSINPQFVNWISRWDDHEFAVRAVLLADLGSQAYAQL